MKATIMKTAFPRYLFVGNISCLSHWSTCDPYQSSVTVAVSRPFLLPVIQPLVDLTALTLVTNDCAII